MSVYTMVFPGSRANHPLSMVGVNFRRALGAVYAAIVADAMDSDLPTVIFDV
jgi:hypothetical protein